MSSKKVLSLGKLNRKDRASAVILEARREVLAHTKKIREVLRAKESSSSRSK